jgi:hypothetical protein
MQPSANIEGSSALWTTNADLAAAFSGPAFVSLMPEARLLLTKMNER